MCCFHILMGQENSQWGCLRPRPCHAAQSFPFSGPHCLPGFSPGREPRSPLLPDPRPQVEPWPFPRTQPRLTAPSPQPRRAILLFLPIREWFYSWWRGVALTHSGCFFPKSFQFPLQPRLCTQTSGRDPFYFPLPPSVTSFP